MKGTAYLVESALDLLEIKMTMLWCPSDKHRSQAQITDLMALFNRRYGKSIFDYEGLHRFSVNEIESFWEGVWDHLDLIGEKKGPTVSSNKMISNTRFFPEANINFAENCLMHDRSDDAISIITHSESGIFKELSWGELRRSVANFKRSLINVGVGSGDVVAGFVANGYEAIVCSLASLSLGAIWTSCSPDFGQQGVLDRFGQTNPKVLIVGKTTQYNLKAIDLTERINLIIRNLPSVTTVFVYEGPNPEIATQKIARSGCQTLSFCEAIDGEAPLTFIRTHFNAPAFILYSSGTTGPPKCIVHGHGGALIQLAKEHRYHVDIKPGDRVFFYTTCGWMMWNWLIASLASQATVITYDGAPFAKGPCTLWDLCESDKWHIFGTSAKYISSIEKYGYRPGALHSLDSLKAFLSTGSPLSHESFDFVYEAVKSDLMLGSISGGTDIISCFCLSTPIKPVYRGELQCAGLGLDVDILDDEGNSITGEKGELICRKPFPAMPVKFFGDKDGSKYETTYFSRFDGVWTHGDFAERTENNGFIIYGRSDTTLNPGGIRIGTAEIYRQVETIPEVLESMAVGQRVNNDMRVLLFVVLKEGSHLDSNLERTIKTRVCDNASPRHVPDVIAQVPDLPRTVSGKIVELAVQNVIHNEPVRNKEALANPHALEFFKNHPDIRL